MGDLTKEEIVRLMSRMNARLMTAENALDTRTQKSHTQARTIEQLTVRVAMLEEAIRGQS